MGFYWILAVALLAFESSAELSPKVTTSLGDLQGTTRHTSNGRTYFAFEGVPYAKPPIGQLRFKESVPVAPWSGLRNATSLSNICTQDIMPVNSLGSSTNLDVLGAEDCLYMNIYTPKLPSDLPDGKLLDVIFYIHLGAFRVGWGSMCGPEYIMDRDVVFISINYRLGVLGFFSLEDDSCPGNNGLKDQLLALKWVNQHIASFGGSPNKITIMGTSAGGASVHYHMLSPQSKGLFQKAVANSGSVFNPWALTKHHRTKSLLIANAVGCSGGTSDVILDCLRGKPAEQLAIAINHLLYLGKYFPLDPLGPIIEKPSPNAFISEQPIDIIKSKRINDVPAIFSFTSDEGTIMGFTIMGDEAAAQQVEKEWDALAPHLFDFNEVIDPEKMKEAARRIRKHYLGEKKIDEALNEFMQIFSDRYFVNGVQEAAMLQAENQNSPVYSYRFSYTNLKNPSFEGFYDIPYKAGAGHLSDILHVLKSSALSLTDLREIPGSRDMSHTMVDYYMNFITELGILLYKKPGFSLAEWPMGRVVEVLPGADGVVRVVRLRTPSGKIEMRPTSKVVALPTQSEVPGWETVKSGLPNFKYLEIMSPTSSENVFVTQKPNGEFWKTLNLQEYLSKKN